MEARNCSIVFDGGGWVGVGSKWLQCSQPCWLWVGVGLWQKFPAIVYEHNSCILLLKGNYSRETKQKYTIPTIHKQDLA